MDRASLQNEKLTLIRNVGYRTTLIINNEVTLSFQSCCQKNALAEKSTTFVSRGKTCT